MATKQIITPDHLTRARVEVTLIMSDGKIETRSYMNATVAQAVVQHEQTWDEAYAREWNLPRWVYAIMVDGTVIFVRQ